MTSDPAARPGWGRIGRWYAGMPRWVRAALGLVPLLLGAYVIVRPVASLGLLAAVIGAGLVLVGVLELVSDDEARTRAWRAAIGALWVVGGVLVLLWPGLTVRALALVVGAALVVHGIGSLVAAARRGATVDARVASALLGAAGIAFGLLALLWPDITLVVVAVVFGARLIIAGGLELWHAARGTTRRRAPAGPPTALRRWTRTIASVVAVALAVGAGALSVHLREDTTVSDPFYVAPRTVPDEPGKLLRSEPFTREVPDDARAWRILYTTTTGDGSPAVASGLVVVPAHGPGNWPVIEWTHGTTGYSQQCAPSLLAQPFESGALFLLPNVIDNGWALVATDYIGLGTPGPHPYLIGQPTGRAALDAVRAARQLHDADLSDATVAWGHSQGGGAALWAGAIDDAYAPDVKLSGVAALAPASNLPALTANLPNITGGSVFASYVFAAYTAFYPDVTERQYVRPGAQTILRKMSTRCLSSPGVLVSVLTALSLSKDPDVFAQDPTTGPLGKRLTENTPPATITAPLLVGQGAADQLVLPTAQDAYVNSLCDAGVSVDYRRYAGRDHVPLVEPDSPLVPQLIQWTKDRFAGVPAATGCSRTDQ